MLYSINTLHTRWTAVGRVTGGVSGWWSQIILGGISGRFNIFLHIHKIQYILLGKAVKGGWSVNFGASVSLPGVVMPSGITPNTVPLRGVTFDRAISIPVVVATVGTNFVIWAFCRVVLLVAFETAYHVIHNFKIKDNRPPVAVK